MANKMELAEIRRIAQEHVDLLEQNFQIKYCDADRETLLAYLRQCAESLDGTLNSDDVVGVDFIRRRLGSSWDKLLQAAGIPKIPQQERRVNGGLCVREARRLEWCLDKARAVLAEREDAFAERNAESSEEELLEYLKHFAEQNGFTPSKWDITGGSYIAGIFKNDWYHAVVKAGLPWPEEQCKRLEDGRLFKAEFARQKKIYDQNMRLFIDGKLTDKSVIASSKEQKVLHQQDSLAQRAAEQAVEALVFKEKLFAIENAKVSDKFLLGYLKECAKEIGRLPCKCEVVGGEYIEKRFGGWEAACAALEWTGQAAQESEPDQRLIYTREIEIQKCLLTGQETAVACLYKSPLIERMQAGNVYHLLRWAPYAKKGADKYCRKEAKERLRAVLKPSQGYIGEENGLLRSETERLRKIFNRTLETLDWQNRQFVAKHKNCTDRELMSYLRECIREINSSPSMLDFVGGEYLARRLGGEQHSWVETLKKVGAKPNKISRPVYKSRAFRLEFQRQERLMGQ